MNPTNPGGSNFPGGEKLTYSDIHNTPQPLKAPPNRRGLVNEHTSGRSFMNYASKFLQAGIKEIIESLVYSTDEIKIDVLASARTKSLAFNIPERLGLTEDQTRLLDLHFGGYKLQRAIQYFRENMNQKSGLQQFLEGFHTGLVNHAPREVKIQQEFQLVLQQLADETNNLAEHTPHAGAIQSLAKQIYEASQDDTIEPSEQNKRVNSVIDTFSQTFNQSTKEQ